MNGWFIILKTSTLASQNYKYIQKSVKIIVMCLQHKVTKFKHNKTTQFKHISQIILQI